MLIKKKVYLIFGVILLSLFINSCETSFNQQSDYSIHDEIETSVEDILSDNTINGITEIVLPYEELILKVKTDYASYIGMNKGAEDIQVDYYIGSFNGYTVLMLSYIGEFFFDEVKTDTFIDVDIVYPNSNYIRAYKDGIFYKLPELFESNELTIKDITDIKNIYIELREKENPTLNEYYKLLEEITTEYAKLKGESINIKYFIGQYNGYNIILFDGVYRLEFNYTDFDDVIIAYKDKNHVLAYKDGIFYDLLELYNQQILSKENIIEIKTLYYGLTNVQIYNDIDLNILDVIKNDYANLVGKTTENIVIDFYAGTYNGYTVLMLSYVGEWLDSSGKTESFDEITIDYANSKYLLAYKDGNFYRLTELYHNQQLSLINIKSIKKIYDAR